ncbi:MAG: site-2 protease family protein [Anaerolineales bacterium]|nr:site-2 protease family protein [Anaerolineae bacterium]PWB70999.1 MAG: site-2 protease family protein [Anaerolineales bacterium]
MNFVIIFFGWIFSLCLHEFSHAFVAYHGGDTTVKDKGYLTFNPLRYTHPFLSIILPLLILLMGGIGLPGGAVYIETWRIRNRYWLSAMALAGPAANGVVAIVLAILLQVLPASTSNIWPGLSFLLVLQIWAIFFNLLPIPPLDGYNVLEPFLAPPIRQQMDRIRGYAFWILLLAIWYIPAISDFLWTVIFILASILGVNWGMVVLGQEYLMNFFRF